jgi:hypothetical protein
VYREATGRKVEVSSVQTALEALRDRDLVWKSSRGAYSIADQALADWVKSAHTKPE